MKFFRVMLVMLMSFMGMASIAYAESKKPTQDEIVALTTKAADLIVTKGIDAAATAFTTEGEFKYGEVYINVIDLQGNWVVFPPKPENKGKSILNFIDEDGKELGKNILNTGLKGEGWIEYRWKNPASNTIQPKVTFIKRVPGKDFIVYSGFYK